MTINFFRQGSPQDGSERKRISERLTSLRFPTAFEEEKQKEFQTYKNYVLALSVLFANGTDLIEEITATQRFLRINRRPSADLAAIGRVLRLAWVTEINLLSSVELAGPTLAGPNTMHQAYYAPYSMMRAFFLASGLEVPTSHSAHLSAMSDCIGQRTDLFPGIIGTLASGDPESSSISIVRPCGDVLTPTVSNLSTFNPDNAWDLAARFFRTTRQRQMDDAIGQWKARNHRARIPAAERQVVADKLTATSLFHCLYRLRVRADYQDADAFLLGIVSESDADLFCRSLATVTSSLLGCLEILVARYLGKAQFNELVESFSKNDRFGVSQTTIQSRWASAIRFL